MSRGLYGAETCALWTMVMESAICLGFGENIGFLYFV